ncbi:TIGR04283 family arsenosugar biosynthesis glycosyltransferase [Deferribacteraceae bacterium V6Fe1]|nr:TIGR04283 family arsenosugar biosynthesis glycosyltransferase [Deferribacteraceae bacterium V6Fe1]
MSSLRDNKSLIIIFTRYPVAGRAKTRLIPQIGAINAAKLQKMMTEFVVSQVRKTNIPFKIKYFGGTEAEMKNWLGDDIKYSAQGDGDLGEKMKSAFEEGFNEGFDKIVVIGSDCPDLRVDLIIEAFKLLEKHNCVIGPAKDGGYYLIGLNKPNPKLFENIDWGSEKVLNQTVSKIKNYKLLKKLNDVDEFEDIPKKISVIIPTLNEEENIANIINQAKRGFNIEVIVVDGGSNDNTVKIAEQMGGNVIVSPPGRAVQMNEGAKIADGEILFFVHADSFLPDNWDTCIRETIGEKQTFLGYFRFKIADDFKGKKIIEFGTNLRANIFKKPYGDQGFFVRKDEFLKAGSFPEVPIMEDLFFVKKAKSIGKIVCADEYIQTSGRRWKKYGALKTTYLNQCALLAALFKYDLNRIKEAYSSGKNPLFT